MEVKVAAKAGFCFGVKRAVDMARKCLHDRDGPVYTLGPLIHNDQVTGALAWEGINIINDLDDIDGPGTVIIRSHGVAPEVLQKAQEKGLQVVDATCPFVRKVQQTVHDMVQQNIPVVVVGDPEHPEVQGIVGWAGGRARVVRDAAQAGELDQYPVVGVVAQTTQRQDNLDAVVNVIKDSGSRVYVYNTICSATAERQQEALELARQVEAVLVLGGKNSANTAKLAQICRTAGIPVYRIETAGEIDPAWFKGLKTIGVAAGASTPGWIIEEVCSRMMEFEDMKEEEVMEEKVDDVVEAEPPTVEAEPQQEESAREEMQQEMEEAVEVKNLKNGEVVKGIVVQVNQDEVLVDVGAKSEGVIPLRELSSFSVDSPHDVVNVGDEINVYVLKSEDNEGKLILSKQKADEEEAWTRLEEIMQEEQVVKGNVREVVKGGLLVDVMNVRAFLPASLVERGYVEDLSKYLNMEIEAKVIELNRPRRKVILSRKAVLEEEYARKREDLLANLEEGQVVKGIVRRLTNFGAFVDIGGVDGLLHISEMAWYRINHPSEVVNVGDELEVMVLRVDRENEKVSLGLKQVLPNPWDNVEEKYPEGSIITAKVVRLAPFGAFVQLEPGVEGLVHISHLADRHVATPDEVVQEGEEIRVKVLSVDPEDKRIRLSIREVNREKGKNNYKEYQAKKQENPTSDGGTVTIGEMVGDIFDEKK
ncbi:bifunctional 4-hydroxy-3-methylbut-2-enyl diphosphate reductase/30S ribosomal protein S1 [Desulfoscipio geothermicus]|uniref:4-hydroxy-3-methylbut-2-enyl diphosphate reductase n=1 Tax=Desulfoscipio geothermicus DSM 3669 TaxID=1121426 RepID=A0A1I6CTY1_9FIRM|nr:bifunctional 4-hydroxy-3-methylbut-2-enyl diphosphate reductase/30S ribosomal protein S1 [Desulfoscipio geothermicus]SFQ96636.1 4-hydroxy-3-methylbut-2-enyl diphosphate reductase [Desulfoscipio geothermicus DSM 3669]